jgi:hypothetical protein
MNDFFFMMSPTTGLPASKFPLFNELHAGVTSGTHAP